MTNKEAIFELIKYRRMLEKDSTIDAEPFDMAIEALERKRGKWIEHECPKNVFSIECSECGCWFLHEHLVRNSFCPNCGADMRGENNEPIH